MADIALAGRVIASHYAEPVARLMKAPATLRRSPSKDGDPIVELDGGAAFDLLDDSLGWAWGYAGADRRVGYVPSDALKSVND